MYNTFKPLKRKKISVNVDNSSLSYFKQNSSVKIIRKDNCINNVLQMKILKIKHQMENL